ncbi:hypothetical protein LINPERHAP1_LOCUS10741 [Linum perenne]
MSSTGYKWLRAHELEEEARGFVSQRNLTPVAGTRVSIDSGRASSQTPSKFSPKVDRATGPNMQTTKLRIMWNKARNQITCL